MKNNESKTIFVPIFNFYLSHEDLKKSLEEKPTIYLGIDKEKPFLNEYYKKIALEFYSKKSPLSFINEYGDNNLVNESLIINAISNIDKKIYSKSPIYKQDNVVGCLSIIKRVSVRWPNAIKKFSQILSEENPSFFMEKLADEFPEFIINALYSLGDKNVSK